MSLLIYSIDGFQCMTQCTEWSNPISFVQVAEEEVVNNLRSDIGDVADSDRKEGDELKFELSGPRIRQFE